MTGAILVLMCSPREPGTRAVGLFGGVYFEATNRADGSWSLGFGVANWLGVIALWLALSGLVFVAIRVSAWGRRPQLPLGGQAPDES
ncbi:hypothetical protein [Sinomonas sp. G460-2]|uniref:hypothetical protein n=1 Tax=Sinomonas sp. G460-2 TaxID=3393464 RepID=UPI0039F00486